MLPTLWFSPRQFWQSLPADLQKVVEDGSKYAMENQRRLNTEMEEELEATMAEAGVEFIHPDAAMVEEMREATKSVWELEDIKNMIDPEIYEMAVQIRDN